MSYTLSTNMCNTTGATDKSVTLPATNFADWALDETNVDTITLSNSVDALDTPETMKVTIQNVKNIYKNSDIPHDAGIPASGVRMVVSVHGTWTESDDSDTSLPKHYAPVACSVTVVVPKWASVKSKAVIDLIGRAVSGYFETDDSVSNCSRISKMLRGIERPKNIG